MAAPCGERRYTAGRARAFGAPRGRDPQRRTRRQGAPRAAEGPTADLGEERYADEPERALDIAAHERCLEPKDAIPRAYERRIPTGVGAGTLGVVNAIDLDDEALRGA